jgi:TRAP-type C4-dicarboxylate transport system permease large subunit
VPLFLALTIVALVVMGALLEGLPAILIFGPLLLPVAVELGVSPLHYGIVFLVALGVGASMPPIGIVTFVAASVLGTRMEEAARPAALYLGVILLLLVGVAAAPGLTLLLPHAFHLVKP